MAKGGSQISSLHIAIAASGGVLLYAALRGVSPLKALKDVTSGAPPAVSTEGKKVTKWTERGEATDEAYLPAGEGTESWNGVWKLNITPTMVRRPGLFITALNFYAGDKYSKDLRWKSGHSDCSSFVGKALLGIGIKPPGGSVTGDYLGSPDWVKVTSPRAGDIAVNAHHMAVFTDGQNGIGQQNPTRNVQRDTMDNLMANTGSWEIRRYKKWWG